MGNPEHMEIALAGVRRWNRWRATHLRVQPDLTRIDLSHRDLRGIDFRGVGLFKANLSSSDLRQANLRQSILIQTDFRNADLSGSHVYGASVWDAQLARTRQTDLVITPPRDAARITADNLEVAQFLYLLLTNHKLRSVIDTVTSKVVLILGRFSPRRKLILESIRSYCRQRNLLPVLFDFEGPRSRDLAETISTLAHLARFVVADLTDPTSVPHELQAIVPHLSVPLVPLIAKGARPYALFASLRKYPWVGELRTYSTSRDLGRRVLPHAIAQIGISRPRK